MKRAVFIIFFVGIFYNMLHAQDNTDIVSGHGEHSEHESDKTIDRKELKDSTKVTEPTIYGWVISERLGEIIPVERDTLVQNFHQIGVMDSKDIAVSYLSNIGSPAQSKIFFDREESSVFSPLNTFSYYLKKPGKHVFLNTKIPYSNIYYQGQSLSSPKVDDEERFIAELSINANKKLNIGLDIDYTYARGRYNSMASKQLTFDLYGSYISERYRMHAFIYNNNFINSENGGIVDMADITDQTQSQSIDDPKSIETQYSNTWNRIKGRQVYLNNIYNLGVKQNDSISVASLILTSYYFDQQRKFISTDSKAVNAAGTLTAMDTLYAYTGERNYDQVADDRMSFWTFTNTFGVSLNEGFKKWMKFGLKAFAEHNYSKYQYPSSFYHTLGERETTNSVKIGGVLSKEKGKFLRYNFSGELGVVGYHLGEFKLNGNLKTLIDIKGKDLEIGANAYVKNIVPTFFESKYQSKYFSWNMGESSRTIDLGNTRRVYVGGEIYVPQTKTRIKGGVENIQNLIYYGSDRYIAQESGSVQVVGFQLEQKLQAGILHWDNEIAYQISSNKEVLPLPSLSVYSNLYITGSISKVLKLQIGAEAHYFTEYYAPGYDPALMQFYNQRNVEIGNFPIATAYLNANLKNTRFFIMMYNITSSMGKSNYFTTPYYPVNPRMIKFGLSWKFNN